MQTGKLNKIISLWGHKIYYVAASTDGRYFVTSSKYQPYLHPDSIIKYPTHGSIYLWDAQTYKIVKKISDSTYASGNIIFSPDGRFLTLPPGGGCQYPSYCVKLYNIFTYESKNLLLGSENAQSIAFSKDSKYIYISTNYNVRVFNTDNGNEIYIFPSKRGFNYLSLSNNNNFLITGEELNMYLWNLISSVNVTNILKEIPIVYPNPTTGMVNIPVICDIQTLSYKIYDTNGKLINYKEVNTDEFLNKQISFNFSSYPNGIYFVYIICGTNTTTNKIVKE